jgi:hypothetical protein
MVEARICSTRPVQEPQELDALVCLRTSSSVKRPCSLIALTMVPLHTPLQPHTSALSGMPAARLLPLWPTSPRWELPNTRLSRMSWMSWPSLSSWKYQAPSLVSP